MRNNLLESSQASRIIAGMSSLSILGELIMVTIKDFAEAQNAFNEQLGVALTGLTGDVAALSKQVETLSTIKETLSEADQATLQAIQDRTAALAHGFSVLDGLTPPEVFTGGETPVEPAPVEGGGETPVEGGDATGGLEAPAIEAEQPVL